MSPDPAELERRKLVLLGAVGGALVVTVGIVVGLLLAQSVSESSPQETNSASAPANAAGSSVSTPVPYAAMSTTTTSTSSTTTRPPASAQEELKRFAAEANAKDYSYIAEAPCGSFAVINAPYWTAFVSWNGTKWIEQPAVMGPASSVDGVSDKVTTRDYTYDGILDFLISWEVDPVTNTRAFGGILSMDGSNTCSWTWRPINDGTGSSIFLDGLYYDDATQTLFGSGLGYMSDGPRQPVDVGYSSDTGEFYAHNFTDFVGD